MRAIVSPPRHKDTKVQAVLSSCLGAMMVVLLASSCNTLPVGYDQLRDRVTGTADTTLLPDSTSSYARYVPLGGSGILYLGKDTSYLSRLVLRFSILDTMDLDSITSFQLVLHRQDTVATISFICRPCSSEWTESGVSWQMADSFNHWLTPGGDFLPDTLATGTLTGDSSVFNFRYVELDSARRAKIRNYGIGIFPQDTGIVAIYSGASTATAPRLRVTYTNGGKQNQRVINDIADASLVDTVATRSQPFDLLVGSGVAFRTWLWFNLDSVPAEATIARADLHFKPETKYRRTETIVLGASRLTESFTQKGANARYEALPSSYATYAVPADGDTAVTIDIRSMVQLWTSRSDTLQNCGLLITSSPEWSEIFRLRIPRSGPDAPRLEIQYVLPPEDRFK